MTKFKYLIGTILIVSIFSLPVTLNQSNAIEKNKKPTIEKTVLDDKTYKKENTIIFGKDKISYRLVGSIPDLSKYTEYKCVFNDTTPKDTSLVKESIRINLITDSDTKDLTNSFELEDKGDTFKLIANNIKPLTNGNSKIEVYYDLEYKGQSTKDLINYANLEYQDGKTIEDMTTTKIKKETIVTTTTVDKKKIDVLTGVMSSQQTMLALTIIFGSLGLGSFMKSRKRN